MEQIDTSVKKQVDIKDKHVKFAPDAEHADDGEDTKSSSDDNSTVGPRLFTQCEIEDKQKCIDVVFALFEQRVRQFKRL